MKFEFASYVREKELSAAIKTSCQRSKNLGMNLSPGLPCRFPQSPGSCGNSFNMAEVLEVLEVTFPVTIKNTIGTYHKNVLRAVLWP